MKSNTHIRAIAITGALILVACSGSVVTSDNTGGAGGTGGSGATGGSGGSGGGPITGGTGGFPITGGSGGGGSGGTPITGGSGGGGSGGTPITGGSGGGGSGGGPVCPPIPSCNWCGGETLFDSLGCVIGFRCANGVDPCSTPPCDMSDPGSCPPGLMCGGDGLCWPDNCPPVAHCNWCGGETVVDANGCVIGYRCANGVDPCVTSPCDMFDPNSCGPGQTCGPDMLCWPDTPCPPAPPCNWCGGDIIRDPNGCIVGYRCANGVDPCATQPCDPDDGWGCGPGEICGPDMLCWPTSSCSPKDCTESPSGAPECTCRWSCTDGNAYQTICQSSAGGGTSCDCYVNGMSTVSCGIIGGGGGSADPCSIPSCCGFPE